MPISIGYKLLQYNLPYHLIGNLVQEICHGHQTSHLCSSLRPDGQRHASACLRPFQELAESMSETGAEVTFSAPRKNFQMI
jgi:hypothetical protein